MATKWIKTDFPGVRYRKHPTRKHGVNFDQYFTIRYKVLTGKKTAKGKNITKDKEEGLGWTSMGWTAKKAYNKLNELKENRKFGQGPQTLAEKRTIEQEKRDLAEQEKIKAEKEAVTLQRFFNDIYLPQAKADKKEKSVEREEGLFNVWISDNLGDLPMKDITPFHLEQLKRDMAAGKQSPRSIEYALSVVRQIFNVAKRLGVYQGENPTSKVKFPKPDNGRMRFLTRAEADALLTALKIKSDDVHEVTLLSLHCGLRFGEIKALTWQDVDTEKGVLTIRDAKAGSRYAFLTEQAAEMLKARKQRIDDARQEKHREPCKPSDLVFEGRNGKLNILSLTFKRTVDELELNEGIDDPRLKICFHSCRHSYASWLIEEGQDLYTVQKLLGHKTNVMTQRYSHISENKFRDAANALSKALRPQTTEQAGEVVNSGK